MGGTFRLDGSPAATTLYCPPRNDVQARAQVREYILYFIAQWREFQTNLSQLSPLRGSCCPSYVAWRAGTATPLSGLS
jgi:hypothetical protein